MKLHLIHDLSNPYICEMLVKTLSQCTDDHAIKNYHPDYATLPKNLFYILANNKGRYRNGGYYVLEEDGEFVCSAGYNEYDFDSSVALVLTRAYVSPTRRTEYSMGNYILPEIIQRVKHYPHVYLTVNEYNKAIYNWFVRYHSNKRPSLYGEWPECYKKFKPIGKKIIYFTEQYVAELQKDLL
jgi:hypothetical protein